MKIQMVDLRSQYEKIKDEIDAAIQSVIDSSTFIKGPKVTEFELALANYLKVNHVVACGNGTDALQIALMALGLERGDEVIIPTFTYVATAEVIALLGLTPILIDVNPNTFCIDINQIEAKITPKTRAIIPVHLFGQSADMESILKLAQQYNLFVIEDNAQAMGACYTFSDGRVMFTGTMGDIGTTSFFPSKNLGCFGDGGALMTNDDALAEKIRMICNHGQKVQYYHECVGVNSRLDTIQAAVLLAKLPFLENYNVARQHAAERYNEMFKDLSEVICPVTDNQSTHVFHQYTIKLNGKLGSNRNQLREYLKENGIPTMVYYPLSVHQQNAYMQWMVNCASFPNAENLTQQVLSLPMHTELTEKEQEFIVKQFIRFKYIT
jgi:dTDP-4-amino-4,6-dideoxygalactose transaminase